MIRRLLVHPRLVGVCASLSASIFVVAGAFAQETKPAPKAPDSHPAAPETPAKPLPKAESVFDHFVEVSGGKAAFEKIKSLSLSGTLEMGMGMKGTMNISFERPAKLLSIVQIENVGELRTGSDGETAWSDNPIQGPRILEGPERDMAMESIRFSDEANWRDRYKEVKTVGVVNVSDKPAYDVEVTMKDGTKRHSFFDQESGLLVKQSMTMQSQMGEMPMEIFISDYKKVGEVLMPHKSKTEVSMQEVVTTFDKVEFNVEFPAEKFKLPDDIQKLKEKKASKTTKAEPDSTPAPEAKKPQESKK